MLGYAACFGGCDGGFAEGVEEGCFSVVDVAHDGYDGGTEGDAGGIFGHGSRLAVTVRGNYTEGIDQRQLEHRRGVRSRIQGQSKKPFHPEELY